MDTRGDVQWAEWADEGEEDFLDAETARLSQDPMFKAALEDARHRAACIVALTQLRKQCGMTQTHVAEAMGIGQSTVSEFEGGATDPHLSTVQRYARAVNARAVVLIEPTWPRHRCERANNVASSDMTLRWRMRGNPEGASPPAGAQGGAYGRALLSSITA